MVVWISWFAYDVVGPDSVVGIVIRYKVEGLGIYSQ